MQKSIFFLFCTLLISTAWAQQIGSGATPVSTQRFGLELGGYTSRGAGTGALVRYLHSLSDATAFEMAAGGATGTYGARAMVGVRQKLLGEDVSHPSITLRAGAESYRDGESVRRNGIGGGLLFSQGFAVQGSELYAFVQPRAQLGIEADSNEFVIVTGTSLGVNSVFKANSRNWIASMELDLGFQNAPNAFMVGLATDI